MPIHRQDEFARVILRLIGDEGTVHQLSPEEEADLIEAEAEIARGELGTAADAEAIFSKYRR